MIVTLFVNTIMLILAWLQGIKRLKNGLLFAFIILFIFLSLRYDFGNDYHGYMLGFKEINNVVTLNYFESEFHYEAAWVLLCRFFGPIGFFGMMGVLALFNCTIYYRFIKKYVSEKHYWLAVFVYVFNPGIMLTHSSAMRQSIAIAFFVLAIDCIIERKLILYLLLIGIASLFHTSSIILLPFYLLTYQTSKLTLNRQIIIMGVFTSLFLFSNSLGAFLNFIISTNFDQYEIYDEPLLLGSGLGLMALVYFFCLRLHFSQYQDVKNSILFKLSIGYFLFIPLGLILALMGRVSMYFDIANIAVFPLIYASFKKPAFKYFTLSLFIFITLYTFFGFFESEVFKTAFSVYKTIF